MTYSKKKKLPGVIFKMIEGKLIYLSAVEREDIQQLREWRNNPELRKNFREFREINTEMQNKWYENTVMSAKDQVYFSIKRKSDNVLLGCCGLLNCDFVNRYAELSIYIGLNNQYIDELGYSEESCKLLTDYGFKILGLNKILAEVYEFDKKKIKLFEKIGFSRDGVLRDHYFYEGKFWNSILFSLLLKDTKQK